MANTLKFGGGTWATKKGSTLAYNDENDRYKPLPFTTTRTSIATRVNKEGLIEVVENDRPRIDYKDDSEGALLLEPQRSNLYSYSEPTTNEGAAAGVSYESFDWGIRFLNCVKFGDNSTTRYRYGGSVVSATQYTVSAFVIMDDLSEPVVGGLSNTGDFSFVIGGSLATTIDNNIHYGNNIYKVSATTISGTNLGNNGIIKYTSQSSKGFRVVGWQVEAGSYPTSYIPTQGAAVTRKADTASGSGNDVVFNDSEGVLFADVSGLADDGTARYIAISDGSNNERVQIIYSSISDNIAMSVVSSNTGQASATAITSQIQYSKLAISYKVNNCSFWLNGFKIHTDTSAVMPSGLDVLEYQRPNNTSPFYGKTKELAYYDTVLTDLELETLTSYRSLNELVTELNLKAL